MADTVLKSGNVQSISAIDVDWDQGQIYPLQSIQFVPGAAADVLVVKEGSASGPILAYFKAAATALDGSVLVKYFLHGQNHRPYIDFSECTLSSGHMVIIERR